MLRPHWFGGRSTRMATEVCPASDWPYRLHMGRMTIRLCRRCTSKTAAIERGGAEYAIDTWLPMCGLTAREAQPREDDLPCGRGHGMNSETKPLGGCYALRVSSVEATSSDSRMAPATAGATSSELIARSIAIAMTRHAKPMPRYLKVVGLHIFMVVSHRGPAPGARNARRSPGQHPNKVWKTNAGKPNAPPHCRQAVFGSRSGLCLQDGWFADRLRPYSRRQWNESDDASSRKLARH